MVDITEATMRGGVSECLQATLHKDNLPTYVGIGGGLIAGNALGKKIQSWYDNSVETGVDPNKWVQLIARTTGRLVTSGLLCAVAGSLDGEAKEALQMAAVGSTGFVAIDALRTVGAGESWVDDYLTLQAPVRRAMPRRVQPGRVQPVRAAPRPVALQGRPAMESAALAPQPLMRTASLRV